MEPESARRGLASTCMALSARWRGLPIGRVLGWLLAGAALFVVLNFPGTERFQARLLTWAQQRRQTFIPVAVKNAMPEPAAPLQRATATATAPNPSPSPAITPVPPTPAPTAVPAGPDGLAEALAQVGLSREQLGYRPRGDWTRFPLPEREMYLLPMFKPLFEEPLRSYDAARTMGNALDRWLRPDAVNSPDSIMRAVYYLGMDRKVGNFRDYAGTANLHPAAVPSDSLKAAVRELYRYAHQDLVHYTFGSAADWANLEQRLSSELAGVPEDLQRELAAAVLNQLDAISWRDLALRRVPPELARKVFTIRDLGDSQGDGTVYYPEIDDLMAQLDEPSMYYAGRKAIETAQTLRLALAALPEPGRCPPHALDIPTPFGRIVVGTCGQDTFAGQDLLLAVDPGGDDVHLDNAGGTAAIEVPVAISVDVAGNDRYDCTAMHAGGCQGAGILGVGVLMDSAGDDTYQAWTHAQGTGFIGQGVLLDAAGRDTYDAKWVAQGAGFFGHGVLLDAAGDDHYTLWWDGQGYGGVGGGVGVLADRVGNDSYYAEPDVRRIPAAYQYRNYAGNGQPNTIVSFVQGASAGRRGDGSDGHSWPGGLGAIVDVAGDDNYQAGSFAQAYGYWYGIGLMYDGAGNDAYKSVYYSLASGAHYSVSAIVDQQGNDVYLQEETIPQSHAGAGVAFAWDFVNALIYDGQGNDRYESNGNCLGRSSMKGNAFLIDERGDDTYVGGTGDDCVGSSDWQAYYGQDPYRTSITGYESTIFSLLLDLGGTDRYLAKDFATGATSPRPLAGDGQLWFNPQPDAATPLGMTYRAANVYGLGVDRPDGVVPEFHHIPVPPPPPPGLIEALSKDLGNATDQLKGDQLELDRLRRLRDAAEGLDGADRYPLVPTVPQRGRGVLDRARGAPDTASPQLSR